MNTPDPESQYATQINVKMSSALKQSLERMNAEHGVPPAELLRRLAQLAVDYERETGELPLKHLRLMKVEPLSPAQTKQEPAPVGPLSRKQQIAAEHASKKLIAEGYREDAKFSIAPSLILADVRPAGKTKRKNVGKHERKQAQIEKVRRAGGLTE